VGFLVAAAGAAVADAFTDTCVKTSTLFYVCPLPNYSPGFALADMTTVYADGLCGANTCEVSFDRSTYTGTRDGMTTSVGKGTFDAEFNPARLANPSEWDYVWVDGDSQVTLWGGAAVK
jgi:hypothetical protein